MPILTQDDLFPGSSETSAILRSLDWSQTPLGTVESWPQSLRTSVSICLNSAFAILIWWGPELVMLYNDAYIPVISNKHPHALGAPGKRIFPEIWDTIGPMLEGVIQKGQAVRADDLLLFLERNGYPEECYFTFSYSPILDESGGVGGIFTPVQETTDRVINERRLRTLTMLAEVRAEQATNAEQACQKLAVAMSANKIDLPFSAIYRFDQDSGSARRCAATSGCWEKLAPEWVDRTAAWPPLAAMRNGEVAVMRSSLLQPEEIPTGFWGLPVEQFVALPLKPPGSDAPQGFVMAAINPRKRLDDSYSSFLSLVSDHISGAITEAEASEQERKRAEALAELDRAKTTFFSNVSHEFRTPLTLIMGPLQEAVADEGLSPVTRERLELAQRNSLRLQKLVNNLLDFSRIEADRVEALFEPVDLAALTRDLAGSFRSTFDRAGLSLEVIAPPLTSPVYVDRDMWEKIVLNLLSNAFKFTLSGGVRVELAEVAGSVHLVVEDTGSGIPAAELPRIFERFRRVEGAPGRSFEGTGIGLALVQELVRLHEGTVSVKSQEGVGSRFVVVIPAGSAHLPADQLGRHRLNTFTSSRVDAFVSEARRWIPSDERAVATPVPLTSGNGHTAAAKPPHAPTQTVRRKRVLLAEDNADMREYVLRLLDESFDVAAVSNGVEAYAAIERDRPDLVLSDIMMPVMDGLALLTAIRSNPALASLPVILLSARAGEEAHLEGLHAGADDYLIKPFSARELIARVSSLLKIAEIRAASEQRLRESEARVREVLERTTDAVFLLDWKWRFSYLNPNAVSLIAQGRDLIGKSVWEEYPEAVERDFYREYHRAMEERVSVRFEEYYPEPLDKWFDVHAYPTGDGIAVFFHDATAKRKSEAALRQTEKLAAAGRLAASISHEINNPLEALTNLLFLLQGELGLTAEGREYLSTAQSELARVSHIASQTLRFYRQSTKPTQVDMADVLDSVVTLYSLRHRHTQLVIERQYEPAQPFLAFEGELRQVFANLVSNASDAIGGNGRIVLRLRAGTDWRSDRKGVRVSVADNGHGISRETMQRLFEPFFSTKGIVGTGLGLWVSRELVEKHGGSMRVRSSQYAEHCGTTFSVFIPFENVS